MDNNGHKLTKAGFEKLKQELHELKTTERERNLEALKEARSQGDLSDNADYDAARDEQARIEARIKEIEYILKHAELIDASPGDKVSIGKTVKLRINGNTEKYYNIVGSLEADPFENKISNESPIGRALLGMKQGQSKRVKTGANKETVVEVMEVK